MHGPSYETVIFGVRVRSIGADLVTPSSCAEPRRYLRQEKEHEAADGAKPCEHSKERRSWMLCGVRIELDRVGGTSSQPRNETKVLHKGRIRIDELGCLMWAFSKSRCVSLMTLWVDACLFGAQGSECLEELLRSIHVRSRVYVWTRMCRKGTVRRLPGAEDVLSKLVLDSVLFSEICGSSLFSHSSGSYLAAFSCLKMSK